MPASLSEISRRRLCLGLLSAPALLRGWSEEEWIRLFDGRSLRGWKNSAGQHAFTVADGVLLARGQGELICAADQAFQDFELELEVRSDPGALAGIRFAREAAHAGQPRRELEIRIDNRPLGAGARTGSLEALRTVARPMAREGEWFPLWLRVTGKRVEVRVRNVPVVDYLEPENPFAADVDCRRLLGAGGLALVSYTGAPTRLRALCLRRLTPKPSGEKQPTLDEIDRELLRLTALRISLVDFHVHLKGGLTLEQALENARRVGIFYGIAVNCGLNFPLRDDRGVGEYLATLHDKPCYVALQGEGREWTRLITPESMARFDYCLTDAMTFRDRSGYRRRLYVAEEAGDLSDPQAFMELYVERTVAVLGEPIDILANPTYLPKPLAARSAELWTAARMDRVIEAAIRENVAIEINNRYKIPSPEFLRRAKAAGAKFSFGTNNNTAELGRMEYALAMVRACGLEAGDLFSPQPPGQKPVQTKRWRAVE